MNSPRHIIILSSLILLIFTACSKSNEDLSIIYNLEDEFVIRPVELLSANGSQLTLEISSLQPDLCEDSEIVYTFHKKDGVSIIELNDITSTANCNTADIPPSTNITLDPNSANRRLLNVKIKEIIENEGQIDEYANRFEIKMVSTDGIRISHRDLRKIQPEMLWGGVDHNAADSIGIAQAFVADITDLVKGRSITQGYYGHFELLSSGTIDIWNDPKIMQHRSAFAIETGMTLEDITNMVADYRSQYPNMRFFVYNAFGESL